MVQYAKASNKQSQVVNININTAKSQTKRRKKKASRKYRLKPRNVINFQNSANPPTFHHFHFLAGFKNPPNNLNPDADNHHGGADEFFSPPPPSSNVKEDDLYDVSPSPKKKSSFFSSPFKSAKSGF
jgi:hypothetical protein